MSILFDECFKYTNLYKAYKRALKSDGKYKIEALAFQRNESVNLMNLQKRLYNRTYKFSGYITFEVHEPKRRVINAPHFVDKIVQLAMHEVLSEIFVPKFISHSFACMTDRGTHAAVNQVQKNIKVAKWKWGNDAYICNVDVRKFFYTIDRDILKMQYRRVIKDEDMLWVMDGIVDSGGLIDDIGLPLGNTLSQLCANIVMNDLDQYCKRYLGYKYYVRYADDVVIMLPNKEETQKAKELTMNFLVDRLNLEANKWKSQIYPVNQGINAFGYKIFTTHKLLRNDSKKKIKRKIKKMPRLIANERMTIEKANELLASWTGHAMHANSFNFIKSIIDRRPYIKYQNNNLMINEEALQCYLETMKQMSGS